ncbi:MAG TPA: hypothetical protein PKD18_09245 [Saprospiraceae bacterium]|nr:hypothetical protein [Saprospiraceae bacterium]
MKRNFLQSYCLFCICFLSLLPNLISSPLLEKISIEKNSKINVEPPLNDLCTGAIDLNGSAQLVLDFTEATNDVILSQDTVEGTATKGIWFRIVGDGSLYDLKSPDGDPLYYYIFEESCDHRPALWSSAINSFYPLLLQPEMGKNYLILFFADKPQVTLDCQKREVSYTNISCEKAKTLTEGQVEYIDFGSVPYSTPAHDKFIYTLYRSLYFKIDGTGDNVLFQRDPFYTNGPSILVYEETDCNQLQFIRQFSSNTQWIINTEIGKKYLIIYSFQFSQQFSFSIKHLAPIQNDDCANAKVLPDIGKLNISNYTAKDDTVQLEYPQYYTKGIWFSLEGDGKVHSIADYTGGSYRLILYEGNCETPKHLEFEDLYSGRNFKWLTEIGKSYKILIHNYIEVESELTLDKFDVQPNDFCEGATNMSTRDTLSMDFSKAFGEYIPINSYQHYLNNALWVKLQGDGANHEFSFSNTTPNYYNQLTYYIFDGSCEEKNYLGNFYINTSQNFLMPTEVGKNYFICFQGNREILLNHKKLDPDYENLTLEKAKTIVCDEQISINFRKIPIGYSNSQNNNFGLKNLFYKITGEGKFVIFKNKEKYVYTNINTYVFTTDSSNGNIIYESVDTDFENSQFFAESGKTYYIEFRAYFSEDSLETKFICEEPKEGDICSSSINITSIDSIPFSSYFLRDDTLHDYTILNNSLWYNLSGDGKIHELRYNNYHTGNIYLFEGDCESPVLLKNQYFSVDNPFLFLTSPEKEYLIVIDNYYLTTGVMYHDAYDAAENDFCVNAKSIQFDGEYSLSTKNATSDEVRSIYGYTTQVNGLWYEYEGNDSIIKLQFTTSESSQYFIFAGDCNSLQTLKEGSLNSGTDITFRAQLGVHYYLLITGSTQQAITFQKNSLSGNVNENCENSFSLNCNDSIHVNFATLPETLSSYDACGSNYGRNAWYSFIGDGKFLTFSNLSMDDYNLYHFNFYEGENCNEVFCKNNYTLHLSDNEVIFFAEKGKKYYLKIYSSTSISTLDFKVTCKGHLENDLCENASIFPENLEVEIDFRFTSNDGITDEFGAQFFTYQSIWYKLPGDGKLHVINNLSQYDIKYTILKGNCNSFQYLGGDYLRSSLSFYAEEGVEYLIIMEGFGHKSVLKFETYEITNSNNTCDNAKPLLCGLIEEINLKQLPISAGLSQGCLPFQEKEIWYSWTAERDEIVELQFSGVGGYGYLQVQIMEAVDCQFEICTVPSTSVLDKMRFNAFSGKKYFIRIHSTQDRNISITPRCIEYAENDICANSFSLNHNSIYEFNADGATPDVFPSHFYFPNELNGLWYDMAGNDSIQIIENTGSDQLNYILAFGDCEEKKVLQQGSINPGETFRWRAQRKYHYYWVVSSNSNQLQSFKKSTEFNDLNEICENAIEISCNSDIYIDFSLLTNQLPYPDPCGLNNGKAAWFSFIGEGTFLEFSLNSFDYYTVPYFAFYESEICQPDSCLGGANLFQGGPPVLFYADKGKKYYVKIINHSSQGVADLHLNCVDPIQNDICENAQEYNQDTIVNFNLGLASSDTIINSESSILQHAAWYKFSGDNKIHSIVPSSNYYYISYKLLKGSCGNYEVIAENSLQRSVEFFTESGYNYLLVIYGNNNQIELEFKSFEVVFNNMSCESAQLLNCGIPESIDFSKVSINLDRSSICIGTNYKELWYKWEAKQDAILELQYLGNNNYFTDLQITMFEGFECPIEKCTDYAYLGLTPIRYNVASGKTYYFRILNSSNEIFTLNPVCITPAINDKCEGAISLDTTTMFLANFYEASYDFVSLPNYYIQYQKGLWYTIRGDGLIHNIVSENGSCGFTLFEGSCDSMKVLSINSTGLPININTEIGKTYFILLGCYESETNTYRVSTSVPKNNNACGIAESVTCGETILLSPEGYSRNYEINFCNLYLPTAWYKIEGKGQNITLQALGSKDLNFSVNSVCNTSGPICKFTGYHPNRSMTFFADSGETYYISAFLPDYEDDSDFEFSIQCEHAYINAEAKNALPLLCGDYQLSLQSFPSEFAAFSYCLPTGNAVYYEFTGDGSMMTLNCNALDGVYFNLYNEYCAYQKSFYSTDSTFMTEPGMHYYLIISNHNPGAGIQNFNVQFGCNAEEVAGIPTMGQWTIIILGLIMLICGVILFKAAQIGTNTSRRNLG